MSHMQGMRKLFPSSEQKFWNEYFLTKRKWDDSDKIDIINGNYSIFGKFLRVLHICYADWQTKKTSEELNLRLHK